MVSTKVDEQRKAAEEPLDLYVRVMVQVRPHRFWAGVFLAGLGLDAAPVQLHQVKGRRPEGKTVTETVARVLQLLLNDVEELVKQRAPLDDEGW